MAHNELDCGLSTTAFAPRPRRYFKCHAEANLCSDFETQESEDLSKLEFMCPYCRQDFDMVDLCCHIEEGHPQEAKSQVCPACNIKVGMDIIGHIMKQHENTFETFPTQDNLIIGEIPSHLELETPSSWNELQDGYRRSPSSMAPDPLLSFISNAAPSDECSGVQSDTSYELSSKEKKSDEIVLDRDIQQSSLEDKDQEEKCRRCEFAQELLLSTMLDDIL